MSTTSPRSGGACALLFPGQGAPVEGMRELVEAVEPGLLELAVSELGGDPFEGAADGTAFAQPAILIASVAIWSGAGRPNADFFAGHSLGELSALVAAGALDPGDGVRLAIARGRLMQHAAGADPGGMLALLGDPAAARTVARRSGVIVANDNAPTQLVVAGSESALETAAVEAKAHRLRTIRLAVRGAFHSASMEPARGPFRDQLDAVELRRPRAPVFSSVTAQPFGPAPAAIRDQLAEALVRPVRWREALLELRERGVETFLEVGPGKALTGMVRRTLDGVEATALEPQPAHA